MSILMQAEIVNVVVLIAVLQADLGAHRKIGTHRIVRPILVAAAVIPLFLEKITTHGAGLTVELAGVAAGVVGGLIALGLIRVSRSATTGKPVSAAKWGYAIFWIAVVGARGAFSYGATHWFGAQMTGWLVDNNIPSAAVTDGLIFMAVALLLTRTLGLARRAHALTGSLPAIAGAGYAQA
jgi:hypothetical protein